MEVAGGGGENSGQSCGNVEVERKSSPERDLKVKRRMKTPSQLEILEKFYSVEAYPSEVVRAELSVMLGLSDRQLQIWFCHRRLKDRKAPTDKRQKENASFSALGVCTDGSVSEAVANNTDGPNNCVSGLSLFGNMDLQQQQQQLLQRVVHKVGTAVPRISNDLPSIRRFYEPPLAISEQRAIKHVEAQLGEPLREDGPILGMEFDPLPPGSFGAPIVPPEQPKPAGQSHDAQLYEKLDSEPVKGASRALREFQFLPEKPSVRNDSYERFSTMHYHGLTTDSVSSRFSLPSERSSIKSIEPGPSGYLPVPGQMPSFSLLAQEGRPGIHLSPAPREVLIVPPTASMMNTDIDSPCLIHPATTLDIQITTPERRIVLDNERLERKLKARMVKEVQAHEKKIIKELEKQDILKRKREEQMRKDMERQDRERQKEEDRLLREKQREEERYQKELRREMERREKFLHKEFMRAEKTRIKEEIRREKEAARLKSANDRSARRIVKGSIELIEDERLELMELAALSSGTPSVLAPENDTLHSLNLNKGKMPEFPPQFVPLKRPFETKPWTDSEENVGDLLMVWKFLISFADVLGLWPFTLGEFTEALHDFESRLLGEIHISLLRSIIKDIEDVARTPATLMTANQNSARIPAGGHTQVVEGVYSWGFDLLSWQRLLTPLTWPEILRQFALSAGFGPKLKKRNAVSADLQEYNEADYCTDNISNLRSGVAAENAVAIMQERGFSKPRRSRHRLTPGTVKFAAFHVLSVEGSMGLSILEVLDKIQRSGLRDLTTSKTPEASISAALSRDTKLFERTAPSTYCVRSPYRKDPADVESIFSAAREKIRLYQSGNVDEEVAEYVEKDYTKKDHDSESDVADDPDVDDLDAERKLKKAFQPSETSRFKHVSQYGKGGHSMEAIAEAVGNSRGCSSLRQSIDEIKSNGTTDTLYKDDYGMNCQDTVQPLEDVVTDESNFKEMWVKGLTERDYGDLSIEERLNVLVSLIGMANEGNTIRIILEERMEAANALKKQIWAEALLDKRRMKEEHVVKYPYLPIAGEREEQNVTNSMVEYCRSPQLSVDIKNESPSADPAFQLVDLNDQQNDEIFCSDRISENFSLQQFVHAAEKSQLDLKALIGQRAEEIYVHRSLPLGQDRRHNRYWHFFASSSCNDPGSGRIFIELCNNSWRVIDSVEGFDALLLSLDVRGIRESHLHSMLQHIEASFKESVRRNSFCINSYVQDPCEARNKVLGVRPRFDIYNSIVSSECPVSASCSNSPRPSASQALKPECNGRDNIDITQKMKDFEVWMWKECVNSNLLAALKYGTPRRQRLLEICDDCYFLLSWEDKCCPSCHRSCSSSDKTFDTAEPGTQCKSDGSQGLCGISPSLSLPLRIKLLKAQVAVIEASIPSDYFLCACSHEDRQLWGLKLLMATTAEDLLQIITMLENSIKKEFFSANFGTTSEVLNSSKVGEGKHGNLFTSEVVPVLPWIPLTASAVALRLMELDASIYYTPQQKTAHEKDDEAAFFFKFPSIYSSLGSLVDELPQDGCSFDPRNRATNMKRGRGRPRGPSHKRGGKSQKVVKFQNGSAELISTKDKLTRLPGWKGRKQAQGSSSKKGHRSIRSRRKVAAIVATKVVEGTWKPDTTLDDTRSPQKEEWNSPETPGLTKVAENASSSERSESNDDNDECDELLVDDFSVSQCAQFTESIEYGMDGEDAERVQPVTAVTNDDEFPGGEDGDGDGMCYLDDCSVYTYINSDYNKEGERSTGREPDPKLDSGHNGGPATSSSGYSY